MGKKSSKSDRRSIISHSQSSASPSAYQRSSKSAASTTDDYYAQRNAEFNQEHDSVQKLLQSSDCSLATLEGIAGGVGSCSESGLLMASSKDSIDSFSLEESPEASDLCSIESRIAELQIISSQDGALSKSSSVSSSNSVVEIAFSGNCETPNAQNTEANKAAISAKINEKISFLLQRYTELLSKSKNQEQELASYRKVHEVSIQEREHLRQEIFKANALKSKVDSHCKELLNENKRIKEESKRFIYLTNSVKNIHSNTAKSDDSAVEESGVLSEERFFSMQFESLLQQYEAREVHFSNVLKEKDCQLQLSLAKNLNQQLLLDQESLKIEALKGQVLNFIKTESDLKKQLSIYVEKFKQVEETLSKSNELFMTFRKETEKMTKNLSKFEKENELLKGKVAILNRNILEMAEEKARNQKATETHVNQKKQLEALCRTFQAERNEAFVQIAALNAQKNPTPSEGENAETGGAIDECVAVERTAESSNASAGDPLQPSQT